MDILPAFSRNLCVVLARRLETTTLKVPRAAGKQLQGNLRYFDLATVIQTLISSHQTGVLVVSQDKHKVAEIFFFRGRSRAPLPPAGRRRRGLPALPEPGGGDFSFTGREVRRTRSRTRSPCPPYPPHGVGADAGRAADAPGAPERPAAGLPPEGRPPRVGGGGDDRAGGGRVVTAQEGGEPRDLQRDVPRCPSRSTGRWSRCWTAARSSSRRAGGHAPGSDPGRLAHLLRMRAPSARASSSSLVIRVIALRFARKDQFAASRSSPRGSRSRRVQEEVRREGAPFIPTW